jgi:bifunctional UDP-N-acetylglucosamine pyrophosphorylase/glucosamine-1-phosphate N-acetyltransferase
MIRGPLLVGDGTRIGYAAELKNAVIGKGVAIGPLCYVADSVLEDEVYLGAMVRTSNQMLDRSTAKSMHDGKIVDTGLEKLGAYIGEKTALGIQDVILPGRVVPAHSIFGPHITISKNYSPGRYVLKQELEYTAIT